MEEQDIIVVSEMGEVWSPKTAPPAMAPTIRGMGVPKLTAIGNRMGIIMAMVPALVPVEKGDGAGAGTGGKGDDTGKKKRDRGENGGRHKSCQQGRKVPGGSKLADHPAERIGEHHNRCNGDHIAAAG